MIFKKFLQTLFCLSILSAVEAQDFSNKGTEFWVGYGYHEVMRNGLTTQNAQDMVLYFTSDLDATVTVSIPGVGWSKTYKVAANSVTESDPIPKSGNQDARLLNEGKYSTGIHITSNNPIVAYAHIYDASVSGATLLFPVKTLGQDYYSLNFTQRANQPNSNSWAFVIATEDNTTVEITPSVNTLNLTAGQTFTVALNKGEIYNILGTTRGNNGGDLTGTRIRSISTGISGCKKIAVFSGSGRLSINCENTVTTSDNVIQQAFPSAAWGRKFLTVPTSKLPNNYFRVAVSDPSSLVTIDGVPATNLINNFYYEILANTPKSIIADKPIMVAQYITSTNGADGPTCGNSFSGNGDPEMIYLSPIEQTIDKITLNSTSHFKITSHYINIIIKSSAVNSFTIDGSSSASSFTKHPQDPSYSYAVLTVSKGAHQLKADSGFNAIAYGYGGTESYGYNAGTNIKDLNHFITLKNQYTTVNFPATCTGTKFFFSVTLPFKTSNLTWEFGNNPHISPNNTIANNNIVPDSSYSINGKDFYVYSLKSLYTFDAAGTYPVKVTAINQTSDGCNGQEEITYDIQVSDAPITDFSYTHAGCATDSVFFKDATNSNGHPLEKWIWQFDDGTTDSIMNPHKLFNKPGTYNIKHTSINDIGCATDTIKAFTIAPQPVAGFTFSKLACDGAPIVFTDQSSITSGKIVKWYWSFGDGTTLINTTNASVTKTYTAPGQYTVTLQVENESGCKSVNYSQLVTVNSSPIVNFDMPGACLPSAEARFTNLTTINDGTGPSLTYSWTFGDGGVSTVQSPLHIYTTAGPFSVNLKATAVSGCTKDSTKVFTNIYPQPLSAFSFSPLKICATDSVRLTDASNAANSTVTEWFWNFGNGKTSNIKNPSIKYVDSGSYRVSLYIKSAAGCVSDTMRQTIYVNKPPAAAFSISGPACVNQMFTINDQSKANSGTIKNWYWKFSDGTSEIHLNSNPFTKSAAIAGNYTISLFVEADNGCKSDTLTQTAVVQPLPVANFVLPQVCVNDPFAGFTDSSYMPAGTTGKPFIYKWNFGDANATALNPNTSTAQNPQHKYPVAGMYNVSLTVTSNTGCPATLTKSFTVNGGSPIADFSIINDGTICSNTQVRIKNNSSIDIGSITKIEFYPDFINNPTTFITDVSPFAGKIYYQTFPVKQTVQTYQVKLVAYSGTNCFAEKIIPVTVNPSPVLSFTAIPDICLNDNALSITEAKETGGMTGTFAFSGRGITSSGLFNPSAAGHGTTTIKYLFTSTAGCKDSASQTIEVIQNPVVRLTSPVYVLEGGSAELSPTISGNAIKYLWTPATYLNNPAIKNPQSVPKDSITYTLTATAQGNCEGKGQVTILILKDLGIPNAFSPNGDGINDFWNIASLSSYPNCAVQVFNRYGSIVYSSVGYSKPWDGTFNGNPLATGVYYYIINPKNGRNPYTGYVTILK